MHSENLKSYIPSFLSDTHIFTDVFNADGKELDTIDLSIADILAQFNVDTATWGLDIYEKDAGIVTDYTKSLDYRRSVIKSKWWGVGKLNADLIKSVCDAFTDGNVQVTFDGTIHVKFTSVLGIPPNMDDLKDAIEQIKPAYLLLDYLFSYIRYEQLSNLFTYDQMSSRTYDDLKTQLPA